MHALLLMTLLANPPAAASGAPLPADPCSPGRSAYGPAVVLPAEFAQGVTLGRSAPAPYAMSLRLYPTYIIDRRAQWRLAAEAGAALANPKLEILLGGRVTKSLYELDLGPVRGIGLHAGVEGLYGGTGRGLVGAMLIADAGGIFQMTVRADRDLTNDVTSLELGLGTHLMNGSTPRSTPRRPVTPTSYLGRVSQHMVIAFNAAIGTVRQENPAACPALFTSGRQLARHPPATVTTLAEFRQALIAHGLKPVAEQFDDPPPPPPGTSVAQEIEALYRGLAEAVGLEP